MDVAPRSNGYTLRRMSAGGRRDFTSTRWTIVLMAGGVQSPTSDEAFSTLFRTYTRPLRAFLRRSGYAEDDAEELVQAFLAYVYEKRSLRHADPDRGRFRSFLLTSLKNYVINQHDRDQAEKRGGGVHPLPLEVPTVEGTFQIEPPTDETPEKVFDREWAKTILALAFSRLRQELTPEKARQFDVLKVHLGGDRTEGGYAHTAASLGILEGAARTEVSRLKVRLRKCIVDEIAHTVTTPEEIEEEIRHLLDAVSR